MTNEAEAFQRGFDRGVFPAAFLAEYEPIKCLARGANGETLVVRGKADDALYIAKVLPEGAGDEGDLLSSLNHPALPRFIARFTHDGAAILVREYVDGLPLDEAADGRALPDAQAVSIGVQLCDILTYLHRQTPPVIHRDIKPRNVILCDDGGVKLIDFGIARTCKDGAVRDTVFSGTHDFAPPEQYGFAQTDARSDIYSLGMLLKYLLTGGELDAEIENRSLRRVVKRCTAFSPTARYPSAARVKRALLADTPKRLKRNSAVLAISMLALGVLLGRFALPSVESRITESQALTAENAQEYARARGYGFIPEKLSAADPDNTVVTWSEYCEMLGNMISIFDPALLPEWEQMTADAPDTEMRRDGGMVSLLFAAELMGCDRFNGPEPKELGHYSPLVWENVTMDYPVFDYMQPKFITAECYDDNYVGPSYDFCLRRLSNVSGKALLEFDTKGDLRLSKYLTLREAAQAVLRLYESAV